MNEVEKIYKKIDALVSKKDEELAKVNEKLAELRADEIAAKSAMDAAMNDLDEAAYNSAEFKLKASQSRRAMYEGKLDQIAKQEYVSEEESEATIDALLDYEKVLQANFEKAIMPHLTALEELLAAYYADVDKTENTLRKWTNTIRKTYYNRSGSVREVNGESTNRFDTPQPVRVLPYTGCKSAGALRSLLDSVKKSVG